MTAVRIDPGRLHSLFTALVNIYSPSGREEELLRFLEEYLGDAGLNVVPRPVDETRYNLEISSGKAFPDILFLGHIDTVPAFDSGQYRLRQEGDLCRGLGTADMKGGCAALIEAFIAAGERGCLPDRAMLCLVVGEEEDGDGTKALLETRSFRHAIVAEPTALQPCTSHFGYIELVISLFADRRHAAMSERNAHPARTMLHLLLKLETLVDESGESMIMNIRDLHSSESGFAVPESCFAAIDLHIPPGLDAAAYARKLRVFLEKTITAGGIGRYSVEFPFLAEGYVTESRDPFISLVHDLFAKRQLGWNPGAFRSHSDANLLRQAGCLPVILGPGSLAAAHTRDEFVPWPQVEAAAELYDGLLAALHREEAKHGCASLPDIVGR